MAQVGVDYLLAGALCLIPCLPIQDAQAGHFDGRYIVRTGDLNGDGRVDLYIKHSPRLIPINVDDIAFVIPRQRTLQPSVSAAEIGVKVEVIKYQGVEALPPIKVDSFVICDGHHRYIAARLCRTEMPQQDWTAPPSPPRYPVSSLRLDP